MTAYTILAEMQATRPAGPDADANAGVGDTSASLPIHPPAPAAYLRGIALRDGFAREFEERTGKNWFAHISRGRPRRRRTPRKGMAAQPAYVAIAPPERADR